MHVLICACHPHQQHVENKLVGGGSPIAVANEQQKIGSVLKKKQADGVANEQQKTSSMVAVENEKQVDGGSTTAVEKEQQKTSGEVSPMS